MSDPRRTGVSSITGKTVYIRHASENDLVRIEEYLVKHHTDSDASGAEVAVAVEERRIIGFGILKSEGSSGCISLFEDSRRKGIGAMIVDHLMKFSQVPKVYTTRYASYFTRYDFDRAQKMRTARSRRSVGLCRMTKPERMSIAAYGKS